MSRVYTVPADVREREKIIGGILSMAQFVWVIAGFLVGLASLSGVYLLTRTFVLAAPIGIMFACSGLPFAFYKKNGVEWPVYIKRKIQHSRKTHKLINKRKASEF